MYERFTDAARETIRSANKIAIKWNHEYIGTEHMLAAIASQPGTSADWLLRAFGITLRRVKAEIEKLVQMGPDTVTMGKLPQTPRAKKAIEYTYDESRNLDFNYIDNDHLILGLLREQEGVAGQVLFNLDANLEAFRNWIVAAHVSKTEPRGLKPSVKIGTGTREEMSESESDMDSPNLELIIDPGSATPEEIAELFTEISTLHRMVGGSGINFVVTDCRMPTGEGHST